MQDLAKFNLETLIGCDATIELNQDHDRDVICKVQDKYTMNCITVNLENILVIPKCFFSSEVRELYKFDDYYVNFVIIDWSDIKKSPRWEHLTELHSSKDVHDVMDLFIKGCVNILNPWIIFYGLPDSYKETIKKAEAILCMTVPSMTFTIRMCRYGSYTPTAPHRNRDEVLKEVQSAQLNLDYETEITTMIAGDAIIVTLNKVHPLPF